MANLSICGVGIWGEPWKLTSSQPWKTECSRNTLKIHVSTFLKETFYQEELSMSRYPRVQSLLLSPKWTKTITLTSDFFPVAPICFQFFFSFRFQTHIPHRILSVKPLIGNSKPQQSNWVFRFLAKKKRQTKADEKLKCSLFSYIWRRQTLPLFPRWILFLATSTKNCCLPLKFYLGSVYL